ncbi:hypothetical protein [Oerskovia flava]|uniref:hypothetical protein n=1 Tax=Oerskovia flava TaxID=2986422 RepID=UPI00223E9118|nr:hypothetical protein [Oerskovia sp. JB1-3-2]
MKKFLAGTLATVLAVGGLAVATATPASAHTPRISPTCTELSVDLTQYAQQGNTVTVTIDDEVVEESEFGRSFRGTYAIPDPAVASEWEVDIVASDDRRGKRGWTRTESGTTTPCVDETAPDTGKEVGLYVYKKLDPAEPPSWENSGRQTLIEHRPGSEWFTELPGDLPTFVCGPGWAAQQDIVHQDGSFTWPEFLEYPHVTLGSALLDWRHHDLDQLVAVPDCESDEVRLAPAPEPRAIDVCGTEDDRIIAEDTEDYTYTTEQQDDGTVTVRVSARPGAEFPEDAETEWSFEMTDEACADDVAPAIPEPPFVVDLCGMDEDGFWLPEDSAEFTYDVTDDTLVAYPAAGMTFGEDLDGYVVSEDGTYATFALADDLFTDEPCDLVPGDIGAVCVGDVPFLGYEIFLPEGAWTDEENPLTITFEHPTGGEDYVVEGLPLAGDLLWPGASDVEPLQWPGWERLEDGSYVETDENFAWTRAGVTVHFEVNPDYSTSIEYPEPTADCANPLLTDDPAVPVSSDGGETPGLAATGTTVTVVAVVAAFLLLGGIALVVMVRRRARV